MSSEHPREPEAAANPAARPGATSRFQTGMRGLIVAVACFGLISWSARSLWEHSHPAVAAARGLESRNLSDRTRAIRELMATGVSDPGQAIPPLAATLSDPEAEVRAGAAEALGVIGGEVLLRGPAGDVPRAAITALIPYMKDREPVVRIAAMNAMARIIPTPTAAQAVDLPTVVGAFGERLSDRDDEVRLAALELLARHATFRPATPPPALLSTLGDPSPRFRVAAFKALVRFSCPLDPWLSLLIRSLEGQGMRMACREAFLRNPSAFSPDAIPALLDALNSRDRFVRYYAARALEPRAQDPRVAAALIPVLLAFLNEPDGAETGDPEEWRPRIRSNVGDILGRIVPGTESAGEVVLALTEIVRTDDPSRRRAAAYVLGAFGAGAEPAIPALVRALREAHTRKGTSPTFEGQSIAEVLAKVAPGTSSAGMAIAALTEVVESDDWQGEYWAANTLAAFGPAAEPAVPALIRALRQAFDGKVEHQNSGYYSAVALRRIAPGTKSAGAAVKALTTALDPRTDHDHNLRFAAIGALPSFGAAAAPALPRLRALRDGPQENLRTYASRAVVAIELAGSGIIDGVLGH